MPREGSISEILAYWIDKLDPSIYGETANSEEHNAPEPAPPDTNIRSHFIPPFDVYERSEAQLKLSRDINLNFRNAALYVDLSDSSTFDKWKKTNHIPDCLTHGKADSIRRDGLDIWRHTNFDTSWSDNKFFTITEIYEHLETDVLESTIHGLHEEKAIPEFIYLLANNSNSEMYAKPLESWINLLHSIRGNDLDHIEEFSEYIPEGGVADLLNLEEEEVEEIISSGLPSYFRRPQIGNNPFGVRLYSRDALFAYKFSKDIPNAPELLGANIDLLNDKKTTPLYQELHLLKLLPSHIYAPKDPTYINLHAMHSWLAYLNSTDGNSGIASALEPTPRPDKPAAEEETISHSEQDVSDENGLKDLQDENQRLLAQIAFLQQRNEETKDKLAALSELNSDLEDRCKDYCNRLDNVKKHEDDKPRIASLQAELEAAYDSIDKLRQENFSLEKSLNKHAADRLKKELDKANRKLKTIEETGESPATIGKKLGLSNKALQTSKHRFHDLAEALSELINLHRALTESMILNYDSARIKEWSDITLTLGSYCDTHTRNVLTGVSKELGSYFDRINTLTEFAQDFIDSYELDSLESFIKKANQHNISPLANFLASDEIGPFPLKRESIYADTELSDLKNVLQTDDQPPSFTKGFKYDPHYWDEGLSEDDDQ